ncbi:hypothetical protein ACFX2B_014049 [Malus domestica]
MDGMNDHERAIAWLWAIEALASFKQVDASLLHDLIALAPPLPDDMGNNAKERVALKSLESLFKFDSCNVTSGDVPSSAQRSKIGFNLTETCQNVLKRIVNETPESDLRTGGPGLLKWDIQPFIMHKRASLPKCALKQLKDSILDGTHLHADVLRKKGGLTLRNDGNRVLLRDSNPRLNESGSNAQNMRVKGIADPLIIEHENKILEEYPSNANLFPSKRHRISSDAENMEDDNRSSVNDSDDWKIKSKKMKRDASYVSESTEQNQIPLHGKERLEDLSERESCDLAENQMGMMEEGAVLEDCIDIYTSSKRCGQSSGNAILKSQSENHLNATSIPQDKFMDEAHQNLSIDQAKDDGGIHPEPITSSVAPPDGTQQKDSAKVATCNNENESHIKASPPVSTEGPQNKSISESSNGLVMENLADENHNSVIGCDDCCVITKKMKWDPSYVLRSIEKNQIPLHVRELLEDSSERDVPLPERERCDLAENQMGTMDKGKVIEDGHDDHTTSKRCGQSTDPAVNKIQTENPCNAGSLPQDTFKDEVPKYTYNDEVEHDGGLHPEQRASFVAAPDETLHKISAEVFNRNSEHDFHVEVSLPASTDESQQKSMANEGKGDEHFPEPRTLGIASLDETQNDSNSECDSHIKVAHPASDEESQQKSIAKEARELLDWLCHYESKTMTDSVEFHDEKIDAVMKKHALLSSQSTSSQYSETTKNVCKKPNEGSLLICDTSNCPVVVHENWLRSSDILYEKDNFKCPFCSYSLALTEYLDSKKRASMLKKDLDAFIHTLEHQPKESLGSEHNKENICMRKFHEDLNAKTKNHQNGHLGKSVEHLGKQCEERENEVNYPQLQNIIGTEQQVAPSGSCIPNNSESRDESVTLVGINLDVSTGEKIWKEKVIQKCIAVVGLDGCQNQVPAKGDTLSVKNTVSLLVDQRQAVVSEKGGLQQHINYAPREPGHALNVDSEQAGAQKSSTSNYNTRLRKKIPYTSPPISQLRRVKVPWSIEEEEMLKKGVQTFSRIDERTLPWKQILEFGGSVFLHSRTPGDLKDKWRNICRRRPKSN